MAHLVELLLPLTDGQGRRFPKALYDATAAELIDSFGGLTAPTRAPAAGIWQAHPGLTERDDIVIFEVMVDGSIPRGGRRTGASSSRVSPRTSW